MGILLSVSVTTVEPEGFAARFIKVEWFQLHFAYVGLELQACLLKVFSMKTSSYFALNKVL